MNHWWVWAIVIWLVGTFVSAFVIGWFNGYVSNVMDGLFANWFAAAIWPVVVTIGLPALSANLHVVLNQRRAAKEAHKVRVEAEKQVLREERLRDAPFRRSHRKLDLRK